MQSTHPPCRHSCNASFCIQVTPHPPDQHPMQSAHVGTVRPYRSPPLLDRVHDAKAKPGRLASPCDRSTRSSPHTGAVESGFNFEEQLRLSLQRGRFIRARLPLNPCDQAQQPQSPTRHAFRIRDTIAAQSASQIFSFPHVYHLARGIVHAIHARRIGECEKKLAPQPIDDRLRIWKQSLLVRFQSGRPSRCYGGTSSQPHSMTLRENSNRIASERVTHNFRITEPFSLRYSVARFA